jgi:hypothetical protein
MRDDAGVESDAGNPLNPASCAEYNRLCTETATTDGGVADAGVDAATSL